MNSSFKVKEFWNNIHINSAFEPTLNPFPNGLVINHKKVGTRYLGQLLSLPSNTIENKIQMDLVINKNPTFINSMMLDGKEYEINYKFEKRYCYTEFERENDSLKYFQYKKYSNSKEFIEYCGVDNYTELFFENKKDIIFIVRNPLHRFISGTIQILFTLLNEIFTNEKLREEIRFFTTLNDSDLKKIVRFVGDVNVSEESLSQLKNNELTRLVMFLLERKWDLLFQDIHTQNYLHHFIEWIYSIKDENKIKIIDLYDCRSNKSLEFFSNLLGNDILKTKDIETLNGLTYWQSLGTHTGTNKPIYDIVLEKILELNNNYFENSTLSYYIRDEFQAYKSLVDSKYFINLQDNR